MKRKKTREQKEAARLAKLGRELESRGVQLVRPLPPGLGLTRGELFAVGVTLPNGQVDIYFPGLDD